MTYQHHVNRYFSFDQKERRGLIITIVIVSLIMFLFFAKFYWQEIELTALNVLSRVAIILVLVAITLVVSVSASKTIAIRKRYTAKYRSWFEGLLIGFVISFISNSYAPVVFSGYMETKTIPRLRHGVVLPGENKKDVFFIVGMAPIACIILSILFQLFFLSMQATLFHYGMIIAAFVAFFSLLPLPKNNGIYLFYMSKEMYFPLFFFGLFFAIATLISPYYSLIIAIIGAVLLYFLFRRFVMKFI